MERGYHFAHNNIMTTTGAPDNELESGMVLFDDFGASQTPTAITIESIKFVICLIGTVVDLVIIYIIFTYKKMHKPVNTYIMNWFICGAMLILFDPSEYRLFWLLQSHDIEKTVLCVIISALVIVTTTNVLFMLTIMFQWFSTIRKSTVFDRHCFKIVTGVWIFVFIEFLVTSSPCVNKQIYENIGEIFLVFITILAIICCIIIHCMTRCTNPFTARSSVPIALITSFMICLIIFAAITLVYELSHVEVMLMFIHLGKLLIYLYPLIAFYLFYKLDPTFALCARKLFRKQKPEDSDNYREELDGNQENTRNDNQV